MKITRAAVIRNVSREKEEAYQGYVDIEDEGKTYSNNSYGYTPEHESALPGFGIEYGAVQLARGAAHDLRGAHFVEGEAPTAIYPFVRDEQQNGHEQHQTQRHRDGRG